MIDSGRHSDLRGQLAPPQLEAFQSTESFGGITNTRFGRVTMNNPG